MEDFALSSHALKRSAQRNLSIADIAFVIQKGQRLHRTGVIFCQLHTKNVPEQTPGNHRYRQLVGTTVVLCKCTQYVVTVYREQRAFQRDSRKTKHCITHRQEMCPHCGDDTTLPRPERSGQSSQMSTTGFP